MSPRGDPDPRLTAPPVEEVPRLVAEGVRRFNGGGYWDAHEAWEEAWHALRAAGEPEAAELLRGLTVLAAGYENAKRGKERGFRRQVAKGLVLARAHLAAAPRLGLADAGTWVEAATDAYLRAVAHLSFDRWVAAEGIAAPPLRLLHDHPAAPDPNP